MINLLAIVIANSFSLSSIYSKKMVDKELSMISFYFCSYATAPAQPPETTGKRWTFSFSSENLNILNFSP